LPQRQPGRLAAYKPARDKRLALVLAALASSPRTHNRSITSRSPLFGESATTSATGSPQRVTEVPAIWRSLPADQIRRSGADNIPDILAISSAGDRRCRYGFAQAEVSCGATISNSARVSLSSSNGRQVYLAYYGHTAWQSLPVPNGRDRQIEVVKGPNSALFGFNAVGE